MVEYGLILALVSVVAIVDPRPRSAWTSRPCSTTIDGEPAVERTGAPTVSAPPGRQPPLAMTHPTLQSRPALGRTDRRWSNTPHDRCLVAVGCLFCWARSARSGRPVHNRAPGIPMTPLHSQASTAPLPARPGHGRVRAGAADPAARLFGIFDFGRAINDWIDATHMANEAARYAAVGNKPTAARSLASCMRAQADSGELLNGSVGHADAPGLRQRAQRHTGARRSPRPRPFTYQWFSFLGLSVTTTTSAPVGDHAAGALRRQRCGMRVMTRNQATRSEAACSYWSRSPSRC